MINPKSGILVVTRNKNTELGSDMYVSEADDDKRLIVCTVVSNWDEKYKEWEVIVTGRYSLYQLSYHGVDYYFLDVEDIIGTIEKNV